MRTFLKSIVLFIGLSLLIPLFLSGCGEQRYDVKYEITSEDTREVTIFDLREDPAFEREKVSLPWDYSFRACAGEEVGFKVWPPVDVPIIMRIYKNGLILKQENPTLGIKSWRITAVL